MTRRHIDKKVVSFAAEAIKNALDYLMEWQVELNQAGEETPRWLSQTYGRVRRIRDYLHRCMASYELPADLDLSQADENLLVSCVVHEIAVLDRALADSTRNGPPPDRRGFLERKRAVLARLSVEFANAPVQRLPAKTKIGRAITQTVQAIIKEVERRLGPDGGQGSANVGKARVKGQAAPRSKVPFGIPDASQAGQASAFYANPDEAPVENELPPPLTGPPPAVGGTASGVYAAAGPVPNLPVDAPALGAAAEQVDAGGLLVDVRRLRDPRLRVMLQLDQRAFQRALAVQDYRLAMVHLASILEAVVIDHAIPMREELGLSGLPDSWQLEQVISTVLGPTFGAMDRAHVYQILIASNLLRPAMQLSNPIVVTPASVEQSTNFVRRVLVFLGFAGSGETGPVEPLGAPQPQPATLDSFPAGSADDDWLGIAGHLDDDPQWP